jgi:threonine aldolase
MPKQLRPLNLPTPCHRNWLDIMSASPYADKKIDTYNQGVLVELLQNRVADLLGKEKALFFHKGVIAQLTALKVVAENSNKQNVILHPNSHIVANEKDAYQALLGLRGIELGQPSSPFTYNDVCTVTESVGSLVVELPLRRAGFKLTPWRELQKMRNWCTEHDCHFHMDGARLWESTPYYQKPIDELAQLFDSVYLSFYKGLGGLSGAILVGDVAFIEQCKTWRSRLGGDMYSAFPMLITALEGLDHQLPLIPAWVERAHEIAEALSAVDKVRVNKPQTNGFLVFLEGPLEALNNGVDDLNQQFGLSLFYQIMPTAVSDIQQLELQVGPAADAISTAEIVAYFKALVELG